MSRLEDRADALPPPPDRSFDTTCGLLRMRLAAVLVSLFQAWLRTVVSWPSHAWRRNTGRHILCLQAAEGHTKLTHGRRSCPNTRREAGPDGSCLSAGTILYDDAGALTDVL